VIDQLVIVNLRHEARDKMPAVLNGVEWQTCLRRILFLNSNEHRSLIESTEDRQLVPPTVEVFRGDKAYRFLLEVVCGLNSPIVGETAVMTHGGMGYAREFHVERLFREVLIARIAPVSREMILNFLAEKALGLPKSY
jgi:hypothetical protein